MELGPQSLLIGVVAAVGMLHTMVPDHWLPISVMARQQNWSRSETMRAALQAGAGHVFSTLAIAGVVWFAGRLAAARYGTVVDAAASIALVVFGLWIAAAAWHAERRHAEHRHGRRQRHDEEHPPDPGTGQSNTKHRRNRTALLLIVGSSPMVEGIPAFFAASKYGTTLIVIMGLVFAASTMATYTLLCVLSTAGLRRLRFGAFERYGEVLSGAAIAAVGLVFLLRPLTG